MSDLPTPAELRHEMRGTIERVMCERDELRYALRELHDAVKGGGYPHRAMASAKALLARIDGAP